MSVSLTLYTVFFLVMQLRPLVTDQAFIPHMSPFICCMVAYILVVGGEDRGGQLDTVEVVSPYPTSNPVRNCMKGLGNFPANIMMAVGTTFGKLNRAIQAAE